MCNGNCTLTFIWMIIKTLFMSLLVQTNNSLMIYFSCINHILWSVGELKTNKLCYKCVNMLKF